MVDRWLLTPEESAHYGLRQSDKDRRYYLSARAWKDVVRPSFTQPDWTGLLDNKWLFAQTAAQRGLSTPRTLGLVHPTGGKSVDGRPIRNRDEFGDWIRDTRPSSFVIKPVAGMASKGVVLVREVEWDDNVPLFTIGDGTVRSLDWVWGSQRGVDEFQGSILQELVGPHPRMSAIGFDAPHTVRMLTYLDERGDPRLLVAALYAGREGDQVNSWKHGALSVHVDVQTGRLGRARTLPQYGTQWLTRNPDNDVRFEGAELPYWADAVELCIAAARATSVHPFVVWEVTITPTGPVLIEGNRNFGIPLLQVHTDGFLKGPFRETLERVNAAIPDGTVRWVIRNSLVARLMRRVHGRLRRS
ncbi:hypothetical protein CW368_09300 [Actinomycetales bacterium SN12]|nr:hypothetical protein CW368_09300 [Actinomycetales bacterium SN12]